MISGAHSEGHGATEPAVAPPRLAAADECRRAPRTRSARDVMLILSSLDRVTADALLLVYFRGLTQDEAACALGLPRGTVSRCVAQGMRELAGRLLTAAQ